MSHRNKTHSYSQSQRELWGSRREREMGRVMVEGMREGRSGDGEGEKSGNGWRIGGRWWEDRSRDGGGGGRREVEIGEDKWRLRVERSEHRGRTVPSARCGEFKTLGRWLTALDSLLGRRVGALDSSTACSVDIFSLKCLIRSFALTGVFFTDPSLFCTRSDFLIQTQSWWDYIRVRVMQVHTGSGVWDPDCKSSV